MFFDDVLALYDKKWKVLDEAPRHFLGTIVVQYEGKYGINLNYYKLVDGQQRLVTASLLLCALRDYVGPASNLYDEINGFLVNEGQSGDLYFKVVPSLLCSDRHEYCAIVLGQRSDRVSESQISSAFARFVTRLNVELRCRELDVERLVNCIVSCMEIVHVDLNKGESPYKIFESLNAKGKHLTQADLVRNYIAMRLPTGSQEEVFGCYWKPIEDRLKEKRSTGRRGPGELTAYIRHYLSMKTHRVPNMNRVYETFRSRMIEQFNSNEEFIGEIRELHRNSKHYDRLLRPENEPDSTIQASLMRLQRAESVTAFPLAMYLYELHRQNEIQTEDFVDALALVENFIIRVFLNGGSTTGLNRLFPSLLADLDSTDILNSLKKSMANKRLYPSDNRIRQNLLTNALYDGNRRARLVFVMDVINRHLSHGTDGYTVLADTATIEHIMPQNLNDEWRDHLGPEAESIHRDFLNTIGNLTLVTQGKNSEVSDGSFATKRSSLAKHALLLNSLYFSGEIPKWDADAIRARTEYLTELILQVWPSVRELAQSVDYSGSTPAAIVFCGQRVPVSSWQDVTIKTSEIVLSKVEHSESFIAKQAGEYIQYFRHSSAKYYKIMNNGWYVYVNRSAVGHVQFCRNLLTSAGLGTENWHVEYE